MICHPSGSPQCGPGPARPPPPLTTIGRPAPTTSSVGLVSAGGASFRESAAPDGGFGSLETIEIPVQISGSADSMAVAMQFEDLVVRWPHCFHITYATNLRLIQRRGELRSALGLLSQGGLEHLAFRRRTDD